MVIAHQSSKNSYMREFSNTEFYRDVRQFSYREFYSDIRGFYNTELFTLAPPTEARYGRHKNSKSFKMKKHL